MSQDAKLQYPNLEMKELFQAILSLKNEDEAAAFFRDLLTIAELKEFATRWQIVKQLLKKKPYLQIANNLKISTTTVTRTAQWLNNGMGGYQLAAKRVLKK